jgi:hypothetical protein
MIVDLWLCISAFGDLLAGFAWSFERPASGHFISYRLDPRPFAPAPFDAGAFWAALAVNLFVSVLMTLINLAKHRIGVSLVLLVLALFQCGNIRLHVVCLPLAQKQADAARRKANSRPPGDEAVDGDRAV